MSQTRQDDTLLCCPFCGGNVSHKDICQHSSYFQVDCKCGASGPIADHDYQSDSDGYQVGHERAVELWNTRTQRKTM